MPLTPTQIEELGEALAGMEEAVRLRPTLAYAPHDHGQLQFHKARHTVRAMFPGNGWGKTRAMGSEVAWWVDHTHPYQPTPKWPVIVLWFCPEFRQFDILRVQLETECLSAGRKYNDQKHLFTWPDGSQLYILSYDRSWDHVQGINPDLVCFDELPPLKLWREMTMRRRGKRKTRFVIGATATSGETAMEAELYLPWVRYHEERGVDLARARRVQKHPDYWIWDSGGIDDNPGADESDRKWYHGRTWSSEAEKRVRLFGGFARFNGNPVFDQAGIDKLLAAMKAADEARGRSRVVSMATVEAA